MHSDPQDRIEQGALVAVITIMLLVVLSMQVRGDELRYRAAAAIAIHGTSNPWYPPAPKPKPDAPKPPKADTDAIDFTFYTFDGCVPCRAVKADIKAKKFPFPVKEFDVNKNERPEFITTVPAFSFRGRDGKLLYYPPADLPEDQRGYVGAAAMIEMVRKSQEPPKPKPKATTSLLTPQQLRAFAAGYRGPMTGIKGKRDDYRAHLMDVEHRFQAWQLAGLSQAECARIHGACHVGLIGPVGSK